MGVYVVFVFGIWYLKVCLFLVFGEVFNYQIWYLEVYLVFVYGIVGIMACTHLSFWLHLPELFHPQQNQKELQVAHTGARGDKGCTVKVAQSV